MPMGSLMSGAVGMGLVLTFKDFASAGMNKVQGAMKGLDKTTEAATKTMQASQTVMKVGAGIMLAGGGIAAALGIAASAAAKFEEGVAYAMTMSGLSGKAYEDMAGKMGAYALELQNKYGIAGDVIAAGFYQTLSSGAAAMSEDFKALSEQGAMLSKMTKMDIGVTIESLSDTLHQFNMQVKDAGMVANAFFLASRTGSTTIPQLTEAFKTAGSSALAFGVSLADTSSVLLGFAAKGIKGAEAGTAFRMMMTRIYAATGEGKKGWDALNKSNGETIQLFDPLTKKARNVIDVLIDMQGAFAKMNDQERIMTLRQLAGEEGVSKLGALLSSNLPLMKEWSKQMATQGEVQKAFNEQMKGLIPQIGLLKARFQTFLIAVGTPLMKALTPVVKWFSTIIGKIGEFLAKNPKIAGAIGAIAAAVSALLIAVGGLLVIGGGLGMLGAGIALLIANIEIVAPIVGIIVAALAAAVVVAAEFAAISYVAYKAWKENWGGIADWITAKVKVIKAVILGFWEGVTTGFISEKNMNAMGGPFSNLGVIIRKTIVFVWNLMEAGKGFWKEFQNIGKVLAPTLKSLMNTFDMLGRYIGFLFGSGNRGAIKDSTNQWYAFGQTVAQILLIIIKVIAGFVEFNVKFLAICAGIIATVVRFEAFLISSWLNIITTLSQAWQSFRNTTVAVWEGIKTSIGSVVDWIVSKVNAAIAAVNKVGKYVGVTIPTVPTGKPKASAKGGGGGHHIGGSITDPGYAFGRGMSVPAMLEVGERVAPVGAAGAESLSSPYRGEFSGGGKITIPIELPVIIDGRTLHRIIKTVELDLKSRNYSVKTKIGRSTT